MALRLGSINIRQLKLESISNAYFGMTPKEQTAALGVAAVVLVLLVVLPVVIASSRIGKLEKELDQGKKQFREVVRAIDSYEQRKVELAGMQQALAGGFDASLSTTMETIAEKNGMKDSIDSLKAKAVAPSDLFEESSVDVRLKKVMLQPLIDFLYAIEHDPDKMLHIKSLGIKPRFDNKQELDVTLTVSSYKLLEGAAEGL